MKVVQGSLADTDVIAAAAVETDAVVHLGFDHDFSRHLEAIKQDVAVIQAVCKALAGSGKLFLNSSGTATLGDTGSTIVQTPPAPSEAPRAASETATLTVCT